MRHRKFKYNDKFSIWLNDCTKRDGIYYIVREEEDGYRVTCTCHNYTDPVKNPPQTYLLVGKDCVEIMPDVQRKLPNWF